MYHLPPISPASDTAVTSTDYNGNILGYNGYQTLPNEAGNVGVTVPINFCDRVQDFHLLVGITWNTENASAVVAQNALTDGVAMTKLVSHNGGTYGGDVRSSQFWYRTNTKITAGTSTVTVSLTTVGASISLGTRSILASWTVYCDDTPTFTAFTSGNDGNAYNISKTVNVPVSSEIAYMTFAARITSAGTTQGPIGSGNTNSELIDSAASRAYVFQTSATNTTRNGHSVGVSANETVINEGLLSGVMVSSYYSGGAP